MEEGIVETPEELLAKQHRKEKKDLQAKIQSMKNAVPKNDKKRRKQLTEEIAKLETDLSQKHEEELRQLKATTDTKPALTMSVKELRCRTAEYMRNHADDFLPFLTNPNTGDMYTTDEFEKYCSDVEHTAAWGGQLELQALTQVLHLPIEVIQADSPTIKIGEEYDSKAITLVYMRHAYGLGEHYNSVEWIKDPANVEDS
eukprot:superscaffoldBa00001269_g9825